jgi:hypothetical protein
VCLAHLSSLIGLTLMRLINSTYSGAKSVP